MLRGYYSVWRHVSLRTPLTSGGFVATPGTQLLCHYLDEYLCLVISSSLPRRLPTNKHVFRAIGFSAFSSCYQPATRPTTDTNMIPVYVHPSEDNTRGVTLDRSLTYTKHLSQLSMKVNARCNFLQRLAGTKWRTHFYVLQTSTTALDFAPAEYCSPTHIDSMQL